MRYDTTIKFHHHSRPEFIHDSLSPSFLAKRRVGLRQYTTTEGFEGGGESANHVCCDIKKFFLLFGGGNKNKYIIFHPHTPRPTFKCFFRRAGDDWRGVERNFSTLRRNPRLTSSAEVIIRSAMLCCVFFFVLRAMKIISLTILSQHFRFCVPSHSTKGCFAFLKVCEDMKAQHRYSCVIQERTVNNFHYVIYSK